MGRFARGLGKGFLTRERQKGHYEQGNLLGKQHEAEVATAHGINLSNDSIEELELDHAYQAYKTMADIPMEKRNTFARGYMAGNKHCPTMTAQAEETLDHIRNLLAEREKVAAVISINAKRN